MELFSLHCLHVASNTDGNSLIMSGVDSRSFNLVTERHGVMAGGEGGGAG